ncbi:MAG TPA: phage tail tip lysozyme, partial [Allosphingosinicella sp.]
MPDLSRADPRQTQQGRVTNNRSGILPARRNTEAPALERIADMRSARRGDVGGAEQLMAMFGSVNRAANSFAEYSAAKDERADQTNSAEAAVDAVTGEFDPELAERSRAYRSTFAKGKTEREVLSHITTLEDEVNALLDDLEKQADQDDVDELILGSLKSYLKPNGRDRDFGDPEAKVLAIERLRAAQAQLRQGAHKRIIEQVTEQSLTDATEGYRLKLRMVEPGDLPGAFEDAFGNLLPSVDRKQAKTALVQLTMDYASSISKDDPVRSLQVLDALLGSTRAGGIVTPIDLPPSSSAPQMAPAAAPGAPTGPAASSAPVRITATGAAGSVADGLHSAGLPAVVVAGFLGNIEHESRFRTNGPSGDSGTAHGLVQWRKERVANFRRIIGKDVKQASVAEQVRFIKWEMDNPRAAGMTVKQRDRILQASTPEEAARFIDQFYERSDGKSRGEREAAARRYFGGRENAIPAVAANYSPEPVSAVDQAVAGQEVAVAMPRSMSLGVEDRIRVGEFRRNLKMTIEKQENDAMNERQARKG